MMMMMINKSTLTTIASKTSRTIISNKPTLRSSQQLFRLGTAAPISLTRRSADTCFFPSTCSSHKKFYSTNATTTSSSSSNSSSTPPPPPPTPTPVNCQLFFGPRGRPLKLNQVSSVDDIKYYAAQWLGISDYNKIRLVKLPNGEKERAMQLSGAVKPESAPITNETTVDSLGGNSNNNNIDLQVLLEMDVKIRHTMYADLPTHIYVHDVSEAKDFSRSLHHYGSWKHKMLLVKYVYQEGFGPEYVGTEGEDVFDRVFISRDETLKAIQDRGMPHKIVKLVGEGKMFELVVAPTVLRRMITTGLLALVLGLDVYLYCHVLP